MSNLCQPGGGASCGACCGLYNFRDHSRAAITRVLGRHTERLRDVPRTPEAFRAAARAIAAEEQPPAFVDVRVCPLLGFLDDGPEGRVGCLGHPLHNGGVDLRDCGVYDARTCQSFECPSFLWLSAAEAEWIRAACPDWYLYGLVVTDVAFVRAIERLVERALGERLDAARLLARPEALRASRRLFALKEAGAEGARGDALFGQFGAPPEGAVSTEPVLRTIDYAALGARAAPEDEVVLCLSCAPRRLEELEAARQQVRDAIAGLVAALSANEHIA
ncbi:MAG: hypothetical protein IRZ16_03180 [Myxococcaceae bacterium]|nr:hypothetical protein [Myxococcaceae bacterium]